jgi:hypothetical protein
VNARAATFARTCGQAGMKPMMLLSQYRQIAERHSVDLDAHAPVTIDAYAYFLKLLTQSLAEKFC